MRREYDRIGMKGEGNIMECEGKEIEWNGRVQEKVRRVWESGRISERKKRPRSPSLLGRPIIDICLSISLHYPFFSLETSHQRHPRGNANGGLFQRQRDNGSNSITPLPAKAVDALLRPPSAAQLSRRDVDVDQWQSSRTDQWPPRRGGPGRGSSQEEKLFLNGWSSQYLSTHDISLHVVSQV